MVFKPVQGADFCRCYDELKAYPGNVHIIVSGTAASAATVLAMAANRLEMTPGSLFMCHDPIMGGLRNEADLEQAMGILRACKNSIINMYCQRTWHSRDDVAAMMCLGHDRYAARGARAGADQGRACRLLHRQWLSG